MVRPKMENVMKAPKTATQPIRPVNPEMVVRARQYIEGLQVDVPMMPVDVLRRLACAHYNSRMRPGEQEDGCAGPAHLDSDPSFLARICTNFLRHQCSKYESHLEEIGGRAVPRESYLAIRTQVLDQIATKYPDLAVEAERQARRSRAML
jgi:hypothetical protein